MGSRAAPPCTRAARFLQKDMKTIAPNQNGGTITPSVHLEFIQNQVGLPESESLEQIEAYHRALFLHQHAAEMELNQQEARIHEDRLAHLETQLREVHAKLNGVEKLVPAVANGQPDIHPNAPWNSWDRFMFLLAGFGIACLLAFGVLNISFNLLESGLITFVQNPVRSYFWAALLPTGALGVKIGWDFIQEQRRRNVYLWTCLTLGIVGVIIWLAAYATVYPTLSKTTTEHLASLSVFDSANANESFLRGTTAGGAKMVDAVIVAAQAIAEIFLSAALGIYMTVVYARHRPVQLAGNPLFTQIDQQRREIEESVARERMALGKARGNQNRLESQLNALVSYARSLFQKESMLRQDQSQQKRMLLDQISEQLLTQLKTFENGAATDRNLPLASSNGK
jgi:hypothetical protein